MSSLTHEANTNYGLANQGATIEIREASMQLQEQVLDLQAAIFRLKKENQELKEKIELQEKAKFNKKVYFCYSDEVPFCPNCFKKQGMLIHLTGPASTEYGQTFNCPECKKEYRMERQ
jgi:predicted nuclease with TOPRIM domain